MLPLGQLDDQDAEEGAKDGEIDFVIANPDEGILCLEVEGGGIECNQGGVAPHQAWQRAGGEVICREAGDVDLVRCIWQGRRPKIVRDVKGFGERM